jgi:hypothetical protein
VSARPIDLESLPALDPLVEAYPFKPYRNYRVLSRKKQDDVLRAELRGALAAGGGFGFASAGDIPPAAALVRPLPWDSGFFGVPTSARSSRRRSTRAARAGSGICRCASTSPTRARSRRSRTPASA